MAGKILIVDDVATNRIVLKVKLAAACYDIVLARNAKEALRMAVAERPDLVLLDFGLPDRDGTAVLRELRADPRSRDLPVIVLTAGASAQARLEALEAGADDFLTKPIDDRLLLARIRNLLRARADTPPIDAAAAAAAGGLAEPAAGFDRPGRIALIARQPGAALRWRAALSQAMPDRIDILTREEALADRRGRSADLFLIAADMDGDGTGTSGLQLMSDLRARPGTRDAAMCIILPPGAEGMAAMALDLGADAVLDDRFDPREAAVRAAGLIRRKHRSDRQRAGLERELRLAVTDPLTGLWNRRHAMPAMERALALARREGRQAGVMVVDIDRFKAVNDRCGHAAGDAALVEVARRLGSCLGPDDLLARIGGEEFLVVLADADERSAQAVAQRLCRAVRARPVTLPGEGRQLAITVSIGLALSDQSDEQALATLARADRALLAAKAEGRDQVTLSRTAA